MAHPSESIPPLPQSLPDSTLVQDAWEFISSELPPAILNHSIRTYLYANAFAKERSIHFDEEGLCVATLFHDLGLLHRFGDQTSFQQISSRVLRSFLEEHKISSTRVDRLSDAIDYHMLPLPRWNKGSEVALLQIGAWMDVMLLRRWQINSREIRRQYPRLDLDLLFSRLLIGSLHSPSCVTGLWVPLKKL